MNKKKDKERKSIVILDTIGNEYLKFNHNFKRQFPNVEFHGLRKQKYLGEEPHGGQCAYCYLSQIGQDAKRDVYFIKILGGDFDFMVDHWWMDAIRDIKPFAINFSVGAHHGNNKAHIKWFFRNYRRFADKFLQCLEDADTQLFAASGNEDGTVGSKYIDRDNDVSFPQRLMWGSDRVHVIGACDNQGQPSSFSSDGEEVLCMYWGQQVPVMNPFTGKTEIISGTSFATPFALGDADIRKLNNSSYEQYVKQAAIRARGWSSDFKHVKAGWGGMLPSMRGNFKNSGMDLIRKYMDRSRRMYSTEIDYFDTKKIERTSYP